MEKADVADAVEAVFQGGEGGALGEEHEDAVEAFVEVGVFFGFEELEAEVWMCWLGCEVLRWRGRLTGEDGGLEELNQFVDLDQHVDCHFELGAEW